MAKGDDGLGCLYTLCRVRDALDAEGLAILEAAEQHMRGDGDGV